MRSLTSLRESRTCSPQNCFITSAKRLLQHKVEVCCVRNPVQPSGLERNLSFKMFTIGVAVGMVAMFALGVAAMARPVGIERTLIVWRLTKRANQSV
jgi:hypothetical protein